MLPLGTKAPQFDLPDVVSGKTISLDLFQDKKATLVMFLCRHCPYVQHIKKDLAKLAAEYIGKGVGIVAISSNDAAAYPDDKPESLKAFAQEEGYTFPFCYDETQEIAKKYTAACTPDFFLFDRDFALAYRGQLDDSRPGNGKPVTGKDLRAAMDAVLAGGKPDSLQKPSAGCNIKWRPGNAPPYFG
jgi:peroxiredoxin